MKPGITISIGDLLKVIRLFKIIFVRLPCCFRSEVASHCFSDSGVCTEDVETRLTDQTIDNNQIKIYRDRLTSPQTSRRNLRIYIMFHLNV